VVVPPRPPCDPKKITVKTKRAANSYSYSVIKYRAHRNPSQSWVFPVEAGTDYETHFHSTENGLDFATLFMEVGQTWMKADPTSYVSI
jgi:hypothetical protein